MQYVRDIEEILEILWMQREKGKTDLCVVKEQIQKDKLQDKLEEMKKIDLVKMSGERVELTEKGEAAASSLIRRHRLAERLLVDVLAAENGEMESTACQFEHILSEKVTDAICTLLGHPKECPHGRAIPEGGCCAKAKIVLGSLVKTLDNISLGETVSVAYILTRDHPMLHKLIAFGLAPGVKIRIHQKFPLLVIQIDELQIAMEKDIAQNIYVREL